MNLTDAEKREEQFYALVLLMLAFAVGYFLAMTLELVFRMNRAHREADKMRYALRGYGAYQYPDQPKPCGCKDKVAKSVEPTGDATEDNPQPRRHERVD